MGLSVNWQHKFLPLPIYRHLLVCFVFLVSSSLWAEVNITNPPVAAQPRIIITTNLGNIEVELRSENAPLTVRNFLQYADRNYYDGTIFHRVIPGFIIQTGGFDGKLNAFEPGQPVVNESVGGLPNTKGSVAMARDHDPDSARAQFFINLKDNHHFDAKYGNPGYTVFGQVISGMEVVQTIGNSKVAKFNDDFIHRPLKNIEIISIQRGPLP